MTALNVQPAQRRRWRRSEDRVRRETPKLFLVVDPVHARHPILWIVATLLVLGCAVFGAVSLNALAADDAVYARQLEIATRAAEIAYGQQLTDVASLESPARIAAAATELGLIRADQPRLLWVDRLLPADGAVHATAQAGRTDQLKPLLARD
ncbi:MAG: hypothetical protein ACI970_000048 [Myxococcota bacterium]|jgi:hypothetical protein